MEMPETYKELKDRLTKEEAKLIENYQFLTAKPLLVVLNIGEEQLPQASALEEELRSHYPQFQVVAVCGELEMELSQLSQAEAVDFRSAMGVDEEGVHRFQQSREFLCPSRQGHQLSN